MNENYNRRIWETYGIRVEGGIKERGVCLINMEFRYEMKIPYYYNAELIIGELEGREERIKFIKMRNVPVSIIMSKEEDIVNIEIPMGENMKIGFIHNYKKGLVEEGEKIERVIRREKRYNIKVRELIIPKMNINRMNNYGRRYEEELSRIHLGEISYGKIKRVIIKTNIKLEIVEGREEIRRYEIEREIERININSRVMYYIKNERIGEGF